MRNACISAVTSVVLLLAFAFGRGGIANAQRASDDPAPAERGTIVAGPSIALGDAVRAPLWTVTDPLATARTMPSGPVIGAGAAFFGDAFSKDRPLVALDLFSGAVRWSLDEAATPGAFADGLVFAATAATQRFERAHVIAVDARTGRVRWRSPGTWVAAVRQLAVVVDGSHLEARDERTGALRWRSTWGASLPHEARLLGSTLLLHTTESGATMVDVFYAYDARDGRARWAKPVNAIAGVIDGERLIVDTTWLSGAYARYAPLQTSVVALDDGSVTSSFAYAPDRARWTGQSDLSARFARDVAADATSVLFRLGDDAEYRYPLGADPAVTAATRYDLRAALPLTGGAWLVRTTDGGAGIARFDRSRATMRLFAGTKGVTFATVAGGYALVVAMDRAIVFEVGRPDRAMTTRLPCTTVARAFVAGDAFVVACDDAGARNVGLALPATQRVVVAATPIPLRAIPTGRPFTPTVRAFALPGRSQLHGAAFDADGALWVCESDLFAHAANASTATDRVARIARDGTIREFAVPTSGAGVTNIVRAPDGAMWFTESSALQLGRIDETGKIREYPLPSELRVPHVVTRPGVPGFPAPMFLPARTDRTSFRYELGGLVATPDGALWVTAPNANALVRMTSDGATRIVRLPTEFSSPGALTRGPGGTLWFTAQDAIGRFTVANGARRFPVDTKRQALTSIAWGPDGNVWFSFFDGRLGRVADDKPVNIFRGPVVAAPNGPLIGGCDGALYVADSFRSAFWRVTTTGDFEEHDVPYAIGAIARSTTCALGFTEAQAPAETHAGTIVP